jgi:diguanylate cyclase (GGDEF)-like protein/PAS domain S-box-containing protein
MAYLFKKDPKKYSLKTWHRLFAVMAFLTSFLFASLSFIAIPYLDDVHQVFVAAVLIGLTSGAMSSLFPDIRIAIGYISMILLPLIISMVTINTVMHILLGLLIILYFTTQIIIILNSYQQTSDLERKKEEVEKEQMKLYKQQETLEHFFKQAPIGIFSYDMELNVTGCNQAFLSLFSLRREEIMGKNLQDVPDQRPINAFQNSLIHGVQNYIGPYRSIKGLEFWVEAKCSPLYDQDHKVIGGIGLIENKTKEHEAVHELEFLAQHDPLTNLFNRRGFSDYMQTLLNGEKHKNYYSLLFYLDLNQFKGINDSLGHTVGDEILISVSKRLVNALEENNCKVSRFGGDEFIIVMPFVSKDEDEAQSKAREYAEQIKNIFTDPFSIKDLHLRMSSSIGIIIIEPNYMNMEEIIRHADLTMYQAKNSSGHISYYNKDLDTEQKKLFGLQHDLTYAADNKQLQLFFQPIVKIKDDALFSAELLIRWQHPRKGLLSPEEFIPLAIKAGLLSQITWWIIDNVCQHISQWKKDNRWNLRYVSININAQQLVENNFAIEFLKKLTEYGLETKDIMIEITERSLIDNFVSTQDVINTLRSQGVKCAVDDFGIGYSSLSYLKKLSFNTLKIDKEFIKDIVHKPKELLLVSTILDIGRQFNYHIVIEGIENKKQKDLLFELDENLSYQGFYFSRPIPVEEFSQKFLPPKHA